MKLSVVVPVYNVEKYLSICIDSIINQSTKVYEVILVDDGSTDTSGTICDSYAEKYDYIKVIHKKNAGLGMARNTGLEKVTGDFVTFVDSDDYWDIDYVESIMAQIKETGCDTCKTSFRRVDLQENIIFEQAVSYDIYKNSDIKTKLLPRFIGSDIKEKDSIPMSSCCTIYSMDIINNNNLRFVSEREWISEDIIFNIDYYAKANFVVLSDYIGYNYRINPGSLTTKYLPGRLTKCKQIYYKECKVLNEIGIYEICRYRLKRQFMIYLTMCFAQLNRRTSGKTKKKIKDEIRHICKDKEIGRAHV